MRFLNPSGLWLLLGVPVLIVIYLIKSQHEDRPVSSTFLWKLSSRFMKKRLPIQRLRKLLLFLLQLVMLITAALMIARPAIDTGKSREYIVIIDASASMLTENEKGVSRFDRAIAQAEKLSGCIDRGHNMSILLAADNATFLLQSANSVNRVHLALDSARCTNGGCNIAQALALAMPLCNRSDAQVYFYTDRDYPDSKNIQIINLNENEWNISVDSLSFQYSEEGTAFLSGEITSHNQGAEIKVGLRVDGSIVSAKPVVCQPDQTVQVSFPGDDLGVYDTIELFIDEKDGLSSDNRYVLCAQHQRTYQVLLASKSPLYLQSVFQSLGSCQLTLTDELSEVELSGYDLYVFDGIYPKDYPTDGSVIQFGVEKLPKGVDAAAPVTTDAKLSKYGNLDNPIYSDLSLTDTTVARYSPLNANAQWQGLLCCGSQPVCMSKDQGNGLRFTVCSFDLHHTNLPMQTDFVVFMRNLVEMSVFDLLESTDYTAGQPIAISVLPAAQQLYVQQPGGSLKELPISNVVSMYTPQSVGIYTAVITTGESGHYADFFVHIPADELDTSPGDALFLSTNPTNTDAPDAIAEIWFYLAGLLLLLLILEWGVYHVEQY